MVGLSAPTQTNADRTLSYIPALVQEKFGIPLNGTVGSCLVTQVVYSISAITGIRSSTLTRHILSNIGIRGDSVGWTLAEIMATFDLPVMTRQGPHWLKLGVTVHNSPIEMVHSVMLGYPVIIIIGREVCDALENEALAYKDGSVIATIIRPTSTENYHSLLAIGVDALDFTIVRDSRHEYAYHGYLRISNKIFVDSWKNLKAISVNVLSHDT